VALPVVEYVTTSFREYAVALFQAPRKLMVERERK